MPHKKSQESSDFVLSLLSERSFDQKLPVLLRYLVANYQSVCFVSSTMTHDMFVVFAKRTFLALKDVVFVDTLSSHYSPRPDAKGVYYVEGPFSTAVIKEAVQKSLRGGCHAVLFDSVTNFWSTQYIFDLMVMANSFRTEKSFAAHPKCFCFVKSVIVKDYLSKIKDFSMIADSVVNLDGIL